MDTGKVLIVDDSPDMRRTLSDALRLKGFAAFSAGDGEDALAQIESQEIAVVILDLNLPKMSGMNLLERLKSISCHTEVIILTGYASLPTAIEAIQRDVFAYLEKPADPEHVVATIRKAMEKRWLIMENARLTMELGIANKTLEKKIHDITNEKAMNTLKDEFVELVSHELRSPLSTISMSMELLESGRLGELNGDQRKPVETALKQCGMMAELIDKFLNISNIEADVTKPDRRRSDISKIIAQAVINMQPTVKRKMIEVSVSMIDDIDSVLMDKDQIMQVCMILLDNAVKYTSSGGKVHISAVVSCNQLKVEVADNGPGVPESEHAAVFKKFFRGSRTIDSSRRGSGLGLALADLIINRHQGNIGIVSPSGGGSVFWFSIPLTTV